MPKARKQIKNTVAAASKQPAYKAASAKRAHTVSSPSVAASAPQVASSSSVSAPQVESSSSSASAPLVSSPSSAAFAPQLASSSSASAPLASSSSASQLVSSPSAPQLASSSSTSAPLAASLSLALQNRAAAAARERTTFTVGAKFVKFALALHCYIKDPTGGPGPLTTSRREEVTKIMDRRNVNKLVGATYLTHGLESAFTKLMSHHPLPGITKWHMFKDAYEKSQADKHIGLPHDEAELAPVERILGYTFTNKGLLELALTAPVKRDRSPNYERLEFLGDAVLEMIGLQAWIDQGSITNAGQKTESTVNNLALQAVCINAGLQDCIRKCSKKDKKDIQALTASYASLRNSNEAYWIQGLSCKTLGDVVESVCGAVFLDSELKLSAVEGVFRKIHWPIVERRLA
ncbi:hypothetical protein BGX34_012209 [Mortierella sp. NVP85]|nr:hypothetical protein BGX34_012209 [Mortierella sp. NVP85]